jgi:hypothetical protein
LVEQVGDVLQFFFPADEGVIEAGKGGEELGRALRCFCKLP